MAFAVSNHLAVESYTKMQQVWFWFFAIYWSCINLFHTLEPVVFWTFFPLKNSAMRCFRCAYFISSLWNVMVTFLFVSVPLIWWDHGDFIPLQVSASNEQNIHEQKIWLFVMWAILMSSSRFENADVFSEFFFKL